jgi:hypothetical protein
MAALVGLALLGQVACSSIFDVCAEPAVDEPEAQTDESAEVEESVCGLPLCGPLGARLYCIEGYESRHYGGAFNRSSGAAGYLQWLPSTARAWGVMVGNRVSEWLAAARIAAVGQAFFRSQWVPVQRGWC